MRSRVLLVLLLTQVLGTAVCLRAQDKRNVVEPNLPQTCAAYAAPLQSTPLDGPVIGQTAEEQNAESSTETAILQHKLKNCGRGRAVELTLGTDSSRNAFLLNPVSLPLGVSLIVDAGVTVYGSRDPHNYQDPSTPDIQCGNYGPVTTYKVGKGCLSLITLAGYSGVYGYGIIDGQGDKLLLSGLWANKCTWWGLTMHKNRKYSQGDNSDPCGILPFAYDGGGENEQASPQVISAGISQAHVPDCNDARKLENCNFTLYKFTIRNPPFHTAGVHGKNVTIWGVKVQSPWNIPNTDGFDIDASNVTVEDTTVANGDQQLVFVAAGTPMQDITVDHFHGYTKGGITILGNGTSVSNMVARNLDFTGDLPSVSGTTVNGVTEEEMKAKYGLGSYAQALPNATNDLEALQITDESQNDGASGAQISNITFQSACIRDIVKPIRLQFVNNDNPPVVTGLTLQDIHLLTPTSQLLLTTENGAITGQGSYQMFLVASQKSDDTYATNVSTLDNVVFDDFSSGSPSLTAIMAMGNELTTRTNVYPPVLNGLLAESNKETKDDHGTHLVLQNNTYDSMTTVSDPSLAYPCLGTMPFVSGELFASGGTQSRGTAAPDPRTVSLAPGDSIALNAVVQPIMTPTTLFVPNSYGKQPGLLSIGSPALTNPVLFYEGTELIGLANLSANGTLATFQINNISVGTHTYTAQYPADQYYDTLNFGSVTVVVQPR
jgi:polygalacturonase